MSLEVVLSVLHSIALLGFAGIGVFFVQKWRSVLGEVLSDLANGLLLGLAAFLVAATPVVLEDGATVDAGAGPVILAGIVAGPIGAGLAAALGAAARSVVSGSFAAPSVFICAIYGLIGIAARHFGIVDPSALLKPRNVMVLSVASFFGSAVMFFLIQPDARAWIWLQTDLPRIWIANAISIAFAVLFLGGAKYVSDKGNEVVEINNRLDLAKRAGQFGIWDFDPESGRLFWDERSKEMHGIEEGSFTDTFQDWTRNLHPDDLVKTKTAFEEALAGGRIYDSEYRVVLPSGQVKTIKGNAIVLRNQ